MFREITRIRQKLSEAECAEVLRTEVRGVLSVTGHEGYPYGMPMNHYYNEADGCLYFHSGMKGHRIDAMERDPKASFCVFDKGFRREGEWALNIRSVIVFGRIERVEDPEMICDIARKLSLRFTDDEAYIEREIRQSGPRTLMFRLRPEHISGKMVKES